MCFWILDCFQLSFTSIRENMTESLRAPLMSCGEAIMFFFRHCWAKVNASRLLPTLLLIGFSFSNRALIAPCCATLKRSIPAYKRLDNPGIEENCPYRHLFVCRPPFLTNGADPRNLFPPLRQLTFYAQGTLSPTRSCKKITTTASKVIIFSHFPHQIYSWKHFVERLNDLMIFVKSLKQPNFQAKSFTPQKCVICDIFLMN